MRHISENGLFLLLFLSLLLAGTPRAMAQGRDFRQAPKALTAIKQGQVAQQHGNLQKAIALYCVAASTGNPEGYFRIGRLLATGPASVRSAKLANSYLAMAMRLGNQQAARYYNARIGNAPMGERCGIGIRGGQGGYLAGLPSPPSMSTPGLPASPPPSKSWSPCCVTPPNTIRWMPGWCWRLPSPNPISTAAPFHPRMLRG